MKTTITRAELLRNITERIATSAYSNVTNGVELAADVFLPYFNGMNDVELAAYFNRNYQDDVVSNGDGTFVYFTNEPLASIIGVVTLDIKRRVAAQEWCDHSELNGFHVVDVDGWGHNSGEDHYSRTMYMEDEKAVNNPGSAIAVRLHVDFKPGTATIDHASLDEKHVDGSDNWEMK